VRDDYAFYHARLGGQDIEQPATPQPGRYRIPARRTDGKGYRPAKSTPVAIWRDDNGDLQIQVGNAEPLHRSVGDGFHAFCGEVWGRCMAVSEADYDAVIAGGSWPDESHAVTLSNRAPTDNSIEAIQARIEDLAREAEALIEAGAAKTQDECDRAADLANEIAKFEKKAEAARKAEKQPFLDDGAAVDRKWSPVIAAASIYRRIKLVVCTPFMTEQARKAELARVQASTSGAADVPPPAKVTAGTRGRAVAMRTVKTTTIIDRAAVLAHFAEHADVTALLQTLAERSVRAGLTPPGVEVRETKVAA
jgi:hypothetical protein